MPLPATLHKCLAGPAWPLALAAILALPSLAQEAANPTPMAEESAWVLGHLQAEWLLKQGIALPVWGCMQQLHRFPVFFPQRPETPVHPQITERLRTIHEQCLLQQASPAGHDKPRLGEQLNQALQQQLKARKELETLKEGTQACLVQAPQEPAFLQCLEALFTRHQRPFSPKHAEPWLRLYRAQKAAQP
jgi:hypothetical protein